MEYTNTGRAGRPRLGSITNFIKQWSSNIGTEKELAYDKVNNPHTLMCFTVNSQITMERELCLVLYTPQGTPHRHTESQGSQKTKKNLTLSSQQGRGPVELKRWTLARLTDSLDIQNILPALRPRCAHCYDASILVIEVVVYIQSSHSTCYYDTNTHAAATNAAAINATKCSKQHYLNNCCKSGIPTTLA